MSPAHRQILMRRFDLAQFNTFAFCYIQSCRRLSRSVLPMSPMQTPETVTAMKSGILKRSVELNGHKTSVSLEDEFWDGLRAIAEMKKRPLPDLLRTIDAERNGANLSSAIRVFVLDHYRTRPGGPPSL